jgi:hypothetical protein
VRSHEKHFRVQTAVARSATTWVAGQAVSAEPPETDEREWESEAHQAPLPLAHRRISPKRHPREPPVTPNQRTSSGLLAHPKPYQRHYARSLRDELHGCPMTLNFLAPPLHPKPEIDSELLIEKEITEHPFLINIQWRRPLIELLQHSNKSTEYSNLHRLDFRLNNYCFTLSKNHTKNQ